MRRASSLILLVGILAAVPAPSVAAPRHCEVYSVGTGALSYGDYDCGYEATGTTSRFTGYGGSGIQWLICRQHDYSTTCYPGAGHFEGNVETTPGDRLYAYIGLFCHSPCVTDSFTGALVLAEV